VVPDIIPEYLPGGGISLLAGAPNVGKTALLAGLLADLRAGRPVLGHQPATIPAIGMINADRGWAKGAGLWLARAGLVLPYYSLSDDPGFDPKRLRRKHERTDLLAGFIDRLELPAFSLILVDPMGLFLGGNLLDYDACMVACHEIRAYLRRRQYTLLATAHSGKLKADKSERYVRTTDQILGTTAIPGFTDAVLHLAAPNEIGKPYYQLTWHPHGAPAEVFQLERDKQGLFKQRSGDLIAQETQREEQVLACLPPDGAALSFAEIQRLAEAIPLSRRTVVKYLNKLVVEGRVLRLEHGRYRRKVQ
jgi:hypothetical protein